MTYLHGLQNIGFHGHFYSTNCLVDSRWTTKITNFGFINIENEMVRQKAISPQDLSNLHLNRKFANLYSSMLKELCSQ